MLRTVRTSHTRRKVGGQERTGTEPSRRFRCLAYTEPSRVDDSVAREPQNTGTVLTVLLFYGYGTVNSRFINSFTRWCHITQPNCYHWGWLKYAGTDAGTVWQCHKTDAKRYAGSDN